MGGIKRAINTAITVSLISTAAYLSTMSGLQTYASINAPKIANKSQLEQRVNHYKSELGIKGDIVCEFLEYDFAGSKKIDENTNKISIGGYLANDAILKHEMYHIYDSHTEKKPNILNEYFWGEPQAVMYSVFDIKL